MGERPILFSAPMVRAILAGKKTQTRRIVKNEFGSCAECFAAAVPHNDGDGGMGIFGTAPYLRVAACPHNDRAGGRTRCPYGVVGDRLWVKETIRRGPVLDSRKYEYVDTADYAADGTPTLLDTWPWKRSVLPSIHMPRGLSRITLEITSVRVEQLHAITDEDATAEGCNDLDREYWSAYDPVSDGYVDVFVKPGPDSNLKAARRHIVKADPPREQFKRLWWSINGSESWDANPWVWVVEFKRVRP